VFFRMNLRTPLSRLRLIAFIEGWSFLILIGIGMPLKYAANIPEPNMLLGSLHGFLFVIYCLSVIEVLVRRSWGGFGRAFLFWLACAVASLVPFGTFVLDIWLRRIQVEDAERTSGTLPPIVE